MLTTDAPVEPMAAPESAPRRAQALDALRGLAIAGMIYSSLLPQAPTGLPAWMFHAQTPPPHYKFDASVAGITWVDLVFPIFIFSMGAAIPLAYQGRRRLAGKTRLVRDYFFRSILLVGLALFIRHVSPWVFEQQYGQLAWLMGLAAFITMGLVFWRPPAAWPPWRSVMLRIVGWLSAIGLTTAAVKAGTIEWDPAKRHDIILVILANASFFGMLLWVITRRSLVARLIFLGLGLAWYIASAYVPVLGTAAGWQFLTPYLPESILRHMAWSVNPGYLRYLFVLIPGTIAGDLLVKWMHSDPISLNESLYNSRWRDLSPARCLLLGAGCLGASIATTIGLYARLLDWTALLNMLILMVTLAVLFSPPRSRAAGRRYSMFRGQMRLPATVYRYLTVWAVFWLAIGLAAEPFEGGIHKDPATLSYLFISAGVAGLLLVFLSVVVELAGPRALSLLALNGQNPLMAYTVMNFLVQPLMYLIPAGGGKSVAQAFTDWLPTGWPAAGRAAVVTLVGGIIVAVATRLRVIWRL